MSSTGDPRSSALDLRPGLLVQELGWDSDVDEDLRSAIMDAIDAEMVEETNEACDVVLLWWRSDDGDVADALVDSMTDLADNGTIWLLTPKVSRPGHVGAAEISEGVETAGLALTSTVRVSADWQADRIVRPRATRR